MNTETKKCPMCAEEIQAEAEVCPYCGARFEVSVRGYCTQCHAVLEADQDGKCRQCGSELLDRRVESSFLEEGAPQPIYVAQPIPPAQPGPARELEIWERKGEGVNVRTGAFFTDLTIIVIICAVLLSFVALAAGQQLEEIQRLAGSVALFAFPAVWLLYFIVWEGTLGTTPGKMMGARPLASLKVVRKDGSPCGYGQAAIRAVLGFLEMNVVGAIAVWATEQNQRIGDLIAGTLVVNKWKPVKVTLHGSGAVLEFADGRRVEIRRLTRGVVHKWLKLTHMRLKGVTPEGRPVSLKLVFPSTQKRERVRGELERFFGTAIEERLQWWRLVVALVAAGIVVLGIIGVVALLAQGSAPVLPQRH